MIFKGFIPSVFPLGLVDAVDAIFSSPISFLVQGTMLDRNKMAYTALMQKRLVTERNIQKKPKC